jgi:glycosyltransferase involved in cell wall biosynthesis
MIQDESSSFTRACDGMGPQSSLTFQFQVVPDFVSIVIPVYGDVEGLRDTLASLHRGLPARGPWEIVVANDGADPAIEKLCAEFDVTSVPLRPNGGSYSARNRGLEQSRGELIAFLDADVQVTAEWFESLCNEAERFDVFAGRVKMRLSPSPTIPELYQAVSFFSRVPVEHLGLMATANMAAKRGVLESVGGFDRRLRSTGDYEFSLRVREHGGFRVGYAEKMAVVHPSRNFRQLLAASERTLWGQQNLVSLYGEKMRPAARGGESLLKLLVPRRNLFANPEESAALSPGLKLRVWLFAWYLKLRTIPAVLRVRRAFRSSGAARST